MSDAQVIDAVIIGGGIAGTSVAYFMSDHAKVVVLEREAQAGLHSTGRSAALFSETYGGAQVRALTRASRSFFERPPRGFVEHALLAPRGALVIGTQEQAAQVANSFDTLRACSPQLQLLDETQMRSMVPVLEPQFAHAGIFEPGAADIDVNALHQGFMRGLRQRGSRVECGVQIHSIERSRGEWLVEVSMRGAPSHTLRAPVIVDAAGAWADEVAALAQVAPLGLEPRRRTAFLFQPPEGVITARWPFVTNVDEDFYFKPDAGLLLGSPANADPVRPHDVQAEELDIAIAIDRIERATTMRIERPMRPWAGLRSFVADGGLVGGFDAQARGFFWVAALGGYGIQTCAAMGEACAHLALGRALPARLADAGLSPAMLGAERLRIGNPAALPI
ncbi:MAG TPA: FAD-binding oxidoreductase [Steroidobacteraceae bacterium]|nr:FAD-binding oxidoreductase [Steroidobacteraceae bacterium]